MPKVHIRLQVAAALSLPTVFLAIENALKKLNREGHFGGNFTNLAVFVQVLVQSS